MYFFFCDASEPVPFTYLTPTRWAGQLVPPSKTAMSPAGNLELVIGWSDVLAPVVQDRASGAHLFENKVKSPSWFFTL